MISGHRDSHYEWLRDLRDGDEVALEAAAGVRSYRVVATQVVDSNTHRIGTSHDTDQLVLVTCWPFAALAAGGSMRYVVTLSPRWPGKDSGSHNGSKPIKTD